MGKAMIEYLGCAAVQDGRNPAKAILWFGKAYFTDIFNGN